MTTDYDIIIKNGSIADGSGGKIFKADIGIEGESITRVGSDQKARGELEIDATGLIVSPGFIDMHSHSDTSALIYKDSESKIKQGVTTEVVGNCGISMAPIAPETIELLKQAMESDFSGVNQLLDWDWKNMSDYFAKVEKMGNTINFAPLVGHHTLRVAVMGFENREPTDSELNKMKSLVEGEMKAGFFGMSTGLVYPPGGFAKTDEIISLAKVVSKNGGIYASHLRSEGKTVLNAASEAIEIGRKAKLPVEISHIKVMGKPNWDMDTAYVSLIENARKDGMDVSADVYPYTAGQTFLWSVFPPWAQEGGLLKSLARLDDPGVKEKIRKDLAESGRIDWQNWVEDAGWDGIVLPEFKGKSIAQLSKEYGIDPFEALCRVLKERQGQASMIVHAMREESFVKFLSMPSTTIGTDQNGITPGKGPFGGLQHPRAYGTFPRILGRYVREKGVISLEEAIKKMTGLSASKMKIEQRGLIKPGYFADIVIFDKDRITDTATFENPLSFPVGITHVIVNGKLTVKNGQLTGKHNGRVLRRSQSSTSRSSRLPG